MSGWRQWRHNPGSPAAVDAGCTCAVIDNCHGAGIGQNGAKYGWWITGSCPLHASTMWPPRDDLPAPPQDR